MTGQDLIDLFLPGKLSDIFNHPGTPDGNVLVGVNAVLGLHGDHHAFHPGKLFKDGQGVLRCNGILIHPVRRNGPRPVQRGYRLEVNDPSVIHDGSFRPRSCGKQIGACLLPFPQHIKGIV